MLGAQVLRRARGGGGALAGHGQIAPGAVQRLPGGARDASQRTRSDSATAPARMASRSAAPAPAACALGGEAGAGQLARPGVERRPGALQVPVLVREPDPEGVPPALAQPGLLLRPAGLALQLGQARLQLRHQVLNAGGVGPHFGQPGLRLVPPGLVAAHPGGVLEQAASFLRAQGEGQVDEALADDGVALLADARAGQQVDHVPQPDARPIQVVLALARAVQPASDGDLGHSRREAPLGVFEHQRHLGQAERGAALPAGEDDVLRAAPAELARALLAEHPAHRLRQVRLARAVGADDGGDARSELQGGPRGEGLEPVELEASQAHGRLGRRDRAGAAPAAPGPASGPGQEPAGAPPGAPPAAASRSRACSAARCSAWRFPMPWPRPSTRSPATTSTTNSVA